MPEIEAETTELARCTWQSFHDFRRVCQEDLRRVAIERNGRPVYKLWRSDCGNYFDELREICPSCAKRVWLTGFDAWWEARKSYHP